MEPASSSAFASRAPAAFQRRPALPAVIFLVAGIAIAFALPVLPCTLLVTAVSAALAARIVSSRPIAGSILLAIALASLGATLAQSGADRFGADDIGAFSSNQPRLVQLELHIDEPPRLSSSSAGGRQLPPKQSVVGSVQRVLTRSGWSCASGEILVEISHPDPLLAAGQQVRVLGMLGRPQHATNPGEFDWADHYREQRILTSLKISRVENIQILPDGGVSVLGWIRASARDLLATGFTNQHAADHALLRALVLGDADPSMRESQQQFLNIGAAYLLSISGMHIAVVAGCVYGLCRLLMRSPRFACLTCLAVVLLYGAIAIPSTSALRAVLLCSAVLVGILCGRDTDKLQLLCIVAGVLLLSNPMELFSAGFQLGFICIIGLILLGRPLLRWLGERDHRRETPSVPEPSVRWKAWIVLRTWIALSVIAWAVSLPIVAYQFGQLSPWAVPSGVMLLPVVAIALIAGCVKILLTLAWPSLASAWAGGARAPVVVMKDLAAMLAHLPAAAVPIVKPSISLIVLYYLMLCLPLMPWPRILFRRLSIAIAAMAACCLAAALATGLTLGFPVARSAISGGDLSITFCDIGAGQCAVVEAPGAAPALIDAGSSTISDVTRTVLGPFLSIRGERTIGSVFLSHSDFDHISAISAALPMFGIGTIYTSHYFAHFASIDPPAQALLDQLSAAGKSPRLLERGDHVALAKDVAIDVLWPPGNCDFNCNNTGMVLRLSYTGKRVLFPADIQVEAMRELLKSPQQLKADVLVAAHHGSSEVTTPAFVAAIDPSIIISSNGSPLTAKQQRFEHMIGQRPLYRTSSCGAITLHIGADGAIRVETFLPKR